MSDAARADTHSLATECSKARAICRQYYDTSSTCPESIRRIVGAVKDLSDILAESEEVLASVHRSYPGQRSLNSRLNDIERFVGKFCQFKQGVSDDLDTSPPNYRRTWTTPRLVFEKKRAAQMYDGLRIENKKFVQFLFVLCLHVKDARPAGPLLQHRGKLEPVASSIRAIAQRLNESTYQVERRQNRAAQGDNARRRALSLTDLEQQIEREWTLLCLRAGFGDVTSRPPLPDTARNLLLSPSQIYHDMIIAHHRDTTSSPLSSSLRQVTLMDDSGREHQALSAATTVTSRARDDSAGLSEHHVILGEPALPLYVADFEMRPRQILKLQSWRITGDVTQKRIIWLGSRSGNELEHAVSGQTLPYTLHSSLKDTDKRLSVTFHGPSKLVWKKDGKLKLSETRSDLTYYFIDKSDCKRFQEEFRDLHLLDTFDVESIRSQWSKSRFEAVNQDLKLWRSREDNTCTMSFYANHLKQHMEFSLDWLTEEIESLPVKQAVSVAFVSRQPRNWRDSFRERLSMQYARAASSGQQNVWTAVGSSASSASSMRSSISSASSIMSGNSSTSIKLVTEMVEWADKFRSMTIQFTARPVSKSAKTAANDDYTRFSEFMRKNLESRNG